MVETLLYLLEKVPYSSKNIDIARGLNKYPENWIEFKRYIKYKFKQR